MWLFPDSREWGLGTREPKPEAESRELKADSRQPEANSR